MKQNFKNILVIRTDRMGDVILTTPSIKALRQHFPDAKISVLVAPATRELVEGNPNIDEVIVFDRQGAHRGLRVFKLIRYLRRQNFDLAILFHTKKITNLICFLANIPNRIGYKNEKYGFLLTLGLPDDRPEGSKHEAQYCLDVLKPIGIQSNDLALYVPVGNKEEQWVNSFLVGQGIHPHDRLVAVHPGASCISKRWAPAKFAELINKIQSKFDYKIVIIGNQDVKSIVNEIKSHLNKPVVDVIGETTVRQLVSLLKRSQTLISNDSGPVQVAAALQKPVIVLYGRNQPGLSAKRWRPLSDKSIVLQKDVGCQICLAHRCQIGFKCLEALTPQEVFEAFDALSRLW